MKLGLGLGLTSNAPAGGVSSLITTDDFTIISANGDEIIDADSFRLAWSTARTQITAPLASGNYKVTWTGATYDGSESGITGDGIQICDNFTTRVTSTTTGAYDSGTISITSGTIRFRPAAANDGLRIDSLVVEAV